MAKFFSCVFMNRDEVNTQKEQGQYPAIFSGGSRAVYKVGAQKIIGGGAVPQARSATNPPLILTEQALTRRMREHSFLAGTKRAIPNSQDGSILTAWVANHSTGFASSCPLHLIKVKVCSDNFFCESKEIRHRKSYWSA